MRMSDWSSDVCSSDLTWYHDAQHSLDCALAMARLIAGHERSVPTAQRLGAHRSVLGVLIALFHDAGYIRRRGDSAATDAEFTLEHVHRRRQFLSDSLPTIGSARDATKGRKTESEARRVGQGGVSRRRTRR